VRWGEVVTHIQSGFACSKKYETKNGIPHLRPNNIGFNGELDLSKLVHIPAEIVDLTKYSLKKGDVLFNNTNSKELVGRAALITQDLDYGFSNHITRLRVNKELITPLWMVLTVNYLWLQGYFLKICQKWIGQAGVNTKMLKSIQIPLPPLPEQKRIVARIEALFSKIDEIKRLRKEANDLAKTLLQSALHEVFSKADEKEWRWVRLGEVVQLINGKAFRPSEWSDTGLPIIRIQNLNDPNKPFNYCNFKVPRKYIIDNGDILLSWSGTPGTSFGAHKWNRGKGVLNQHIFKVIFKKEWEVNKDYFVYSVNHKLNELIQKAHGGVGLQHVTKKKIQELQIPLPSLPEQKRIVAYLDSIQQKAQALQKLQTETEKEIERLREAILHKVFRGEL